MSIVYLESPSFDPSFNLALEQYIFDEMPRQNEYFMLWQNDNSVIVGKHQNTIEEINSEFVRNNGIQVVRRLSGGGAVYHDLGNLNFTFIMDAGDAEDLNLRIFSAPLVKVLNRLGVKAEQNGRNDITVEGMKFSGNAQYLKGGRIMHHGTILFHSDLNTIEKVLNVSKDKIESKGLKSVKSRVTNLIDHLPENSSLKEFKDLLKQFMFEEIEAQYTLTEDDLKRIREIKSERYDKWAWNFGYSPRYTISKERYVAGVGKIQLYLDVDKGEIKAIEARGDYFGAGNSDELGGALIGRKLEENELRQALQDIDINHYFKNLDLNGFLDVILT
jgi:lipoyltransferase and lipoate-protein ligase